MGYFTDLYAKVSPELDKIYQAKRNEITGAAAGAQREAEADMAIQASKGGYLDSPLFSALKAKNASMFSGQKNQALATLGAQEAQDRMNLNLQAGQAALQDKTAEQQFWGNMATGAGGLLGAALKVFGGPGGIAAGTAVDALTNVASNAIGGSGSTYGLNLGGAGSNFAANSGLSNFKF